MNTYFNEAKTRTVECKSVETFSKDYFFSNKFELFKKGLPFIINSFFCPREDSEVIVELNKYFGKKNLKVRLKSSAQEYANDRTYIRMDLGEYLTEILNDENESQPYAANNFIDDSILELFNIESPLPESSGKLRMPKIWIGAKGTSTPLHKDSTDNFAIHLYGEKSWSIFSITDINFLYFEQSRYGDYLNPLAEFEVSSIDLGNVDHEKFPLFKNATRIDLTLKAGDLLYLPYGWGHRVENISASVMINFWFELNNYKPLIVS